eukprot:4090673-Alexandrium_andersonii.AAC.1
MYTSSASRNYRSGRKRGGINGTKEVKSTRCRGEDRALSRIRRTKSTHYPTDGLRPPMPKDVVARLFKDISGPTAPIGDYGSRGFGE